MNAVFLGLHVRELSDQAAKLMSAWGMNGQDSNARHEAVIQILFDDSSDDDVDLQEMVEQYLASRFAMDTAVQLAA